MQKLILHKLNRSKEENMRRLNLHKLNRFKEEQKPEIHLAGELEGVVGLVGLPAGLDSESTSEASL